MYIQVTAFLTFSHKGKRKKYSTETLTLNCLGRLQVGLPVIEGTLLVCLTAVCMSIERRRLLGKVALPAKESKGYATIWKFSVAGHPKEVKTVHLTVKSFFFNFLLFL